MPRGVGGGHLSQLAFYCKKLEGMCELDERKGGVTTTLPLVISSLYLIIFIFF